LKYKHIIWDWNGTLLDDVDLCIEVMNSLLEKRKIPLLDKPRYREVFDFPVRDYYSRIGFDFTKESFDQVGTEFINNYNDRQYECNLHKQVKTLLAVIHQKGISQSILSARKQEELEKGLKFYDIDQFIEHTWGLSDHYAHGKIENGKKLLKHLKVQPEKCVLIGDTKHDFEVATELGTHCVLFTNGHHSKQILRRCNTHIINNLNELLPLLFDQPERLE